MSRGRVSSPRSKRCDSHACLARTRVGQAGLCCFLLSANCVIGSGMIKNKPTFFPIWLLCIEPLTVKNIPQQLKHRIMPSNALPF